ncbi:hypothetical protein CYMTET_55648, partial [Cymbomonas tetramitiformis]
MAPKKASSSKKSLDDELDGNEGDFTINEEYAKRFEHNKEREELQRLQSKVGGEVSDVDESSEEEDEHGFIPQKLENQFASTLQKISKRDPTIYKEETQFYSEEEEEDETPVKSSKKSKPLYLKDLLAQQLLEDGAEADYDNILPTSKPHKTKTYAEEQEDLRSAFKNALNDAEYDDDDDDDEGEEDNYGGSLLKKRKRTDAELAREAKEDEQIAEERLQKKKEEDASKVLETYFGKVEELGNEERFLRDYLLNKGWLEKEERDTYDNFEEDEDEDEEQLDAQDKFESEYNFRFEEPGSEKLATFARDQAVVRKDNSKRKRQRAAKDARKKESKSQLTDELKRLKALKRKELDAKLKMIREVSPQRLAPSSKRFVRRGVPRALATAPGSELWWNGPVLRGCEDPTVGSVQVAGVGDVDVVDDDLNADFDPAEHDKRMAAMFGEDYYAHEEQLDVDEDMEKPVFGDEDEELAELLAADSEGGAA